MDNLSECRNPFVKNNNIIPCVFLITQNLLLKLDLVKIIYEKDFFILHKRNNVFDDTRIFSERIKSN